MRLPPPSFQRTPIDPSRVVCLGPLPEHIELPTHRPPPPPPTPTTRIFNSGGQPTEIISPISPLGPSGPPSPLPLPPGRLGGHYRSETNGSTETLGSNYTEEEGRIQEEIMTRHAGNTHQQQQLPREPPQLQRRSRRITLQPRQTQGQGGNEDDMPNSPQSMERIEGTDGLIHVPQVADKRYSWEQDSS
jgi:hypothetical protein